MTAPTRTPGRHTPPLNHKLANALAASEPLAGLLQRLQASRQRFDAVQSLLPPPLRTEVRPGPLDDDAWSLLASNAAAAAKLRQMLPALQARLAESGWQGPEIKVRIQPRA
jgi:hypothetical protein